MKVGIAAALVLLLSFAESPVCLQNDNAQDAIALVGGTLIDVTNLVTARVTPVTLRNFLHQADSAAEVRSISSVQKEHLRCGAG